MKRAPRRRPARKHGGLRDRARLGALAFAALLVFLQLAGCGRPEGADQAPSPATERTAGRSLTLGDIDPDLPADRVRSLQPLADYLTARLADRGFGQGKVRIARDIDGMAVLLQEGKVDVYLDTIFPSLTMRRDAGTRIVLQRAVKGVFEYRSVLVAQRDGDVESIEDLGGRVVAFQEDYSTSGYFLPAGMLRRKGVDLVEVGAPEASVEADQTGYLFTRDEENTLAMVLDGRVALGALSSQDYEELAPNLKERLRVVERTLEVPRSLVSVRATLEPELVERICTILLELRGETLSDEEEAWTWSFAEISPRTEEAFEEVSRMMELTSEGE